MARKPRVLHVDDDPDQIAVTTARFTASTDAPECAVLTAQSGAEALRTLSSTPVDVLVTDSMLTPSGEPLPVAARRIAPALPIVIFTGAERDDLPADVRETAVDAYVRKGDTESFETLESHVRRLATERTVTVDDESAAPATDWRVIRTWDPEGGVELGTTVVHAVEETFDVDVDDHPPLYDSIDPEMLHRIFARSVTEAGASGVEARFGYAGYEVTVTADGEISARPLERD